MSLPQLLAEVGTGEDSEALAAVLSTAGAELQEKRLGEGDWTAPKAAQVLTAVSDWILKFSASKKLSTVLSFIEKLLKTCNLNDELNLLIEKDDIGEIEGLFSPSFVSCLLSLLNSVMSSAKIERYSKLLISLLRISSLTVHHSAIAAAFRRKGILKQLLTLYIAILKQTSGTESTSLLLHWLSIVLIKLALYHEKCRDYMIRKGVVQNLVGYLGTDIRENDRLEGVIDGVSLLGAMAGNSNAYLDDQQLMVWVANGVQVVLRYYQYAADSQNETSVSIKAAVLYLFWRLSIANAELQVDLEAKGASSIALLTLSAPSVPLQNTVFAIGLLRRLSANNDFKPLLAPLVLEPVFSYLAQHAKSANALLLKEAIGCLGSIATETTVLPLLLDKNFPELVIDIATRNLEALKLVKTCLGALVNASLSGNSHPDRTMDRVASNSLFYQLVEGVFERHGSSAYFLDYTLRMVANVLNNREIQTDTSVFHLSTGKTVLALAKALHGFPADENIARYSIRILRMLLGTEKGKEAFGTALQGRESETLEDLFTAFDAQLGQIDIVIEGIHFLAALLSTPSSPYLPLISSNSHFPKSMNACLTRYRVLPTQDDKEKLAVVTESLGALPVEDMGNPF